LAQFFSDLDPVSLSLKQILHAVGAPLKHVWSRASAMHRLTAAALFGYTLLVSMLAANAADLPDRSQTGDAISNQLNRNQFSGASKASPGTTTRSSLATDQVGILFLRGDGGDPKELRVEDDTLVLIAARDGSGNVYQNGRLVDVNSAIQESAGQIALAMFRASAGAQVPISQLPVPAQKALSRFSETGVKPRVMFARIINREDTAKVSDIRAIQIRALDASARVPAPTEMVDLVRTAMRTFGLKSDVCDNSVDRRCNQPGVREAFAQIKRDEALQRLAEPR
jgi:hypothetical protein